MTIRNNPCGYRTIKEDQVENKERRDLDSVTEPGEFPIVDEIHRIGVLVGLLEERLEKLDIRLSPAMGSVKSVPEPGDVGIVIHESQDCEIVDALRRVATRLESANLSIDSFLHRLQF